MARRFRILGLALALNTTICGSAPAATLSWSLRCDALFSTANETASPTNEPLQHNLVESSAHFGNLRSLRRMFLDERVSVPKEMFPDEMIIENPVVGIKNFADESISMGSVQGREVSVARALGPNSPLKIAGVAHDVYFARVTTSRKLNSTEWASDMVLVAINRKNKMTGQKIDRIELEIQVIQVNRSASGQVKHRPIVLDEELALPSSISVDSVVRKITVPESRDAAGVFRVWVQTSQDSISIFELNSSELKTYEELKVLRGTGLDRPRRTMRLARTMTVREFEGQ